MVAPLGSPSPAPTPVVKQQDEEKKDQAVKSETTEQPSLASSDATANTGNAGTDVQDKPAEEKPAAPAEPASTPQAGLDPKVQFLATQRLNINKPNTGNTADTPGENQGTAPDTEAATKIGKAANVGANPVDPASDFKDILNSLGGGGFGGASPLAPMSPEQGGSTSTKTGATPEDFSVNGAKGVYGSYDDFINDVKPFDEQDKAGNGAPMGVTKEDLAAKLKTETDPEKRRVLDDASRQFDGITKTGTGTPDKYINGPEMANWYENKHDATGGLSEMDQLKDFKGAMTTLNEPGAESMMDYLEWRTDHKAAKKDNGRYGTAGMTQLSNLSPDDPAWTEIAKDTKYDEVPPESRQKYIDAAKTALQYPDQLDEVNGGDGIFEKKDTEKWLADRQTHLDGEIDPFSQKSEGNCWWLTGVGTVANSEKGREQINHMITEENGNYVVNFPGDPSTTYVVPPEVADQSGSSDGDRDMRVLSEAARMYFENPANKDKTDGNSMQDGGFEWNARELLLGKNSEMLDKGDRAKLEEAVKNSPDGLIMSFAAKPGDDGVATEGSGHAYGVRNIDFDNNKVTYFNPWDSGKEMSMSVDEFLTMNGISYNIL
jgi:hypothetical protein